MRVERTPDDPNNEPTQMAGYDYRAGGNYSEPAGYYSEYREAGGPQADWSAPPEPPPTPWYLQPLALIGWGVLTALLIAGLVWGMVRLVNKESGDTTPATTSETSVTSTTAGPGDTPVAPAPAPETTPGESTPPAPTTEPPPSSSEPPSTTEPPTSTAPTTTTATTAPPTTTAETTTQAPATTTAAAQPPSEIVIPLPPGL